MYYPDVDKMIVRSCGESPGFINTESSRMGSTKDGLTKIMFRFASQWPMIGD
jgi:hypothetical protein